MESFLNYALLRKEKKRGAVWLWGAPNAGKSTLLRMLQEIFHVVPYKQTKSKFDIVYSQSQIAPQFVEIDEGAYNTFFINKSLYNDAKLTFEGEGFVTENKYKNACVKWQGLPIIVTSNRLPWILSEQAGHSQNQEEKYDHYAFASRIKFHKLNTSYSNTDEFPYTTADLAQHLNQRLNEL